MSRFPRLLALLGALVALPLLISGATPAALAAPAAVPVSAPAAAPHAAARPTFVVDGAVTHRLTATVRDLRRLPEHRATVRFATGTGEQIHHYRGVRLIDVLSAAGPRFDPAVKHDELRHGVLVGATDGYQTALSWAELDPGISPTEVLLAYEEDGAALAWPRLVPVGDKKGARYVTDVNAITLLRAGR